MTTMSLQSVEATIYNRIATDTAGAAVRAVATVIPNTKLVTPFTFPLVVFHPGPMSISSADQMGELTTWWWCYEGGADLYMTTTILALIAKAFTRDSIPYGEMHVSAVSQPLRDSQVGAWGRNIRLTYTRRGGIYV